MQRRLLSTSRRAAARSARGAVALPSAPARRDDGPRDDDDDDVSPPPPPPPPPRMTLDEASPPVHLLYDVGFKPAAAPGAPRRHSWPLFGLTEPPAPTSLQRAIARRLFGHGARYLGDQHDHVKPGEEPSWVEIAVVGRSNVGKSTLLNRLLGAPDDKFVRVSRRPGSTTHLDWYGLGASERPSVCVVDSPGYGYNVRGRSAGASWLETIAGFLGARSANTLGRTLVLFDARLGITPIDREVLELLEARGVPWHGVLTKVDTVSDGELEGVALRTAMELGRMVLPYPVLHAVSGRTGEGLEGLLVGIAMSSKLHRRLPERELAGLGGGGGGGGGGGRGGGGRPGG